MKNEVVSRERLSTSPAPAFVEAILKPSYEFMSEYLFGPLMTVNRVWTVMLVRQGIIERETGMLLLNALDRVEVDGAEGLGEFVPGAEFFYSQVESRVAEIAGWEVAGMLSIGRTRPEPLLRLMLREQVLAVMDSAVELLAVLIDAARNEMSTVMPYWTHMRAAQPTTLAHYYLAVVETLLRDYSRIDSSLRTVNRCTLGCGALAGTSYPIDREFVAECLGFNGIVRNTLDCVANADYALDVLYGFSCLANTLGRLAEDFHLWSTTEFGLIDLPDAFSGSSSMMPQKKNPYALEEIRVFAAEVAGYLNSARLILHNVGLQDLKEIEEGLNNILIEGVNRTLRSLRFMSALVPMVEIKRERMKDVAGREFSTASELAAVIHRSGASSYRQAHRIVGDLVRRCAEAGRQSDDVRLEDVAKSTELIGDAVVALSKKDILDALDATVFVERHDVVGGPSEIAVRGEIDDCSASIEILRASIAEVRERIDLGQSKWHRESSALRLR